MGREIQNFNAGWRFGLGGMPVRWTEGVCLPHPVTLTPAISSGGRNYQGPCRYEKELWADEGWRERKLILEFEGAMGVSRLYVNGNLAKTHACGYTPVVADITEWVRFGGSNRIEMELDNSDNEDVPPGLTQKMLDFTYEGGLYRDARLIVTERLHLTHALLADEPAGGGVFVWYSDVSEQAAMVHIRSQVCNETGCFQNFILRAELRDRDGKVAAIQCVENACEPGKSCYTEHAVRLENPRLWSPESPELYRLCVTVEEGERVWDSEELAVGVRTFAFTRDQGIIFNGKARRLNGANYHQTYPYIGNAVPDSLLWRDAKKLRSIGMESIRSHYPFASAFTEACSRLGLALIVSLPGWQWFKEGAFAQQCEQNLRDIIRWQRNIPAVLLWEPLPNETQLPAWFQLRMVEIVKEEYPYEPCYTGSDYGPTIVSYREYDPAMLAPGMEDYSGGSQRDNPKWVREYGDYPDNWTDQNCAWRAPRGFGDGAMLRAAERMLGLDPQLPEGGYWTMVNRTDICGFGVWPGIEHNRGYHVNPCWGGYFDLFRLPKFTCELIRSQMGRDSGGNQVFIANWWMEFSPEDVTVFSNAEQVRLYYDGVLVGEENPMKLPVPHPPFLFRNVRRKFKKRGRGTLTAEALVSGRVVAVAVQKSPGAPKRLVLEADDEGIPLLADGADLLMVHCKVLDADGTVVPWMADRHPILFEAEGEGEIVGDASIGANPICPEAGIASILVRSTPRAGEITLRARMLWEQHGPYAISEDQLILESVPERQQIKELPF